MISTVSPDHRVVVIGAGVGGICAGVQLRLAGIDDFIVVDKAGSLGGTWRDNVYPGVAVDIPSLMYQYSFMPNPDWSRVFAPGAEVQAYHEKVSASFGLTAHFRFGVEIVSEAWDDDAHLWRLLQADGTEITTRFVISAIGPFFDPKAIDIPGLDSFAGTRITPSHWDSGTDVRGRSVAVIGTGATGVQLSESIAPRTASLTVFQRTPVYCVPKPDFPIPAAAKWVLRIPGLIALVDRLAVLVGSVGLWFLINTPAVLMRPAMRAFDAVCRSLYRTYLQAVVNDPATARALLPSFGIFGNRPTLNTGFPRIFNRPQCTLVTTPIEEVLPDGVRTTDGVVYPADILITATGFELFSESTSYRRGRVVGVGGLDLSDFFADHGMHAYESVAITGFPNRWIIVGPYSWTGNGGWHGLVETATTHIVRALGLAEQRSATRVEVRAQAFERFKQVMLSNGKNLRYYFTELNQDVRSYWKNSDGDIPLLRPTTLLQARRAARAFPADDYQYDSVPAIPVGERAQTRARLARR